MEVNKEKIRYILQFVFHKGRNKSQAAEIMNGVYGADIATANYLQFWFRCFRSDIFDVKDAPRTGSPVVENVDKIRAIIEVDWHIIIFQQLDLLKLAIDQKRPELANKRGVGFYQDNAKSHTSVVTRQKLWKLGREVLIHPPYSPDLAPRDYYLFLAFQNSLSDKKLGSSEDWENRLREFFAN
ncbi:histone-lysine N-methyltransferase SETMAR [Trichonephila clavipes]|nr:histone-lysine N-methyltransferase SETMAR [Trichonephila clavipes]